MRFNFRKRGCFGNCLKNAERFRGSRMVFGIGIDRDKGALGFLPALGVG